MAGIQKRKLRASQVLEARGNVDLDGPTFEIRPFESALTWMRRTAHSIPDTLADCLDPVQRFYYDSRQRWLRLSEGVSPNTKRWLVTHAECRRITRSGLASLGMSKADSELLADLATDAPGLPMDSRSASEPPKAARRRKPLPKASEGRALELLWERYTNSRDADALDELIASYSYLVVKCAKKIGYRFMKHVSPEDIQSYAISGLRYAIETYQPSRGMKFERYAVFKIFHRVNDILRDLSLRPRGEFRRNQTAAHAEESFIQSHGRRPDENELADAMGMTTEKVRKMIGRSKFHLPGSLLCNWEGFDDFAPDRHIDERQIYNATANVPAVDSEELDYLQGVLRPCPRRVKAVVLGRIGGMTLRETADMMGLSQSLVSTILNRSRVMLYGKLKGSGFAISIGEFGKE